MPVSWHPRRVVAAVLALFLMAGLPLPAAATLMSGTSRQGPTPSVDSPAPWWVEWRQTFDRNGNRIDDEAERIASARVAKGMAQSLVPVLVSFAHRRFDVHALANQLGASGVARFKTQPMVDIDVPARSLHLLSTFPDVVAVEYDRPVHPLLDVSTRATQASNGGAGKDFYNGTTAEDLGYTGQSMVVAVLDTGVQEQHDAFAGKWIAGTDVSPQAPVGAACAGAPDDEGHGTHVASTVLGRMASNDLFGTAKDARLVEVRIAVGGATATVGPASVGSINRGFEFVRLYNERLAAGDPLCGSSDDHIDVATLSFGSLGRGGPNAGSTEPFIDALVNSGVAVTVAVGNCGPEPSATCTFGDEDNGISSPGNAFGAIGVASYNDVATVTRSDDAISTFSSRGPNAGGSGDTTAGGASGAANLQDRYRKPEIAAPGENIQAAGPVPFTLSTKSGTSMATPHVAGIAALLLEAGERAKSQTGGVNLMASVGNGYDAASGGYVPGVYPVRDAIINSAEYKAAGSLAKWTGPNSQGLQWNNAWGYGQVNAFGALCWAWANVLGPGGATAPAQVATACAGGSGGGGEPTPEPEPTNGISIVDPFGDANYLNGQGFAAVGDQPTEQDVWGAADIGQVWFSHDPDTVSAHIQTREPAPGDVALFFRVQTAPGSGTACLWFQAATTGAGDVNMGNSATLRDTCATALPTSRGTISFSDGPEGTGIITITFPRAAHPALAHGKVLRNPIAHSRNTAGATAPPPGGTSSATAPQIDDTVVGSSYTLTGPFTEPTPDPSVTVGTTDPLFDLQWGLAKIQAPQAWSQATGSGINIAIVDSGLDLGHEDFACPGKLSVLPGSDVGDGDNDPQDEDGHGTHVAGIAGACTDNGKGVAGVAPDATIIPVRALGDADLDAGMADGIRFATDNGAHVINLSIGDIPPFSHLGPDLFPETEAALEYARTNGVVIAAAAGNFDQPTCEFPAMSRNVICVVATDSGDLRTYYTDFAVNVDRNSEEPGLEPVVAAPGGQGTFCEESIVSTYLRTEESICYDTGYEGLDGTSMSSPHVAGVAALLYELFGGARTRANADAVVQAILDSAADLGTPGYDPVYGYGRLDALAAVNSVAGANTQLEFSSVAYAGTFSHPTTIEATLTGEDGEPLSGKSVVFELVGDGFSDSWTVTTVDGLASKTLPEDLAPGTYQLFAHFAREQGVFQPSSAQAILDVGKEGTSVATGASGKGPSRVLQATLVDDDGAPAIEGRTVVLYGIEGEVLGSDVTDGNGFASIPAPPGYRGQDAIWEARFDGADDPLYAGSSKRHPN